MSAVQQLLLTPRREPPQRWPLMSGTMEATVAFFRDRRGAAVIVESPCMEVQLKACTLSLLCVFVCTHVRRRRGRRRRVRRRAG